MRKNLAVTTLILIILVTLIFLINNENNDETEGHFSEIDAINKVLEKHPQYPSTPNKNKVVKDNDMDRFWYKLELGAIQVGKETYIITLGKNNRYVVDDEVVEQYIIYKVSPEGKELITEKDNTEIMSVFR
ncbi:hypothetical protein E3U55_10350 [Filobacillus milosensis]|uniref:Uncharacterized protein n=1 Tax=Filobacillus milosensis TaxID=94137 RepID=A0A4Y8IFW7_9BACI|nr:hypothetical protein [Filobacillus milosensis]TFB19553.1 hypothetical protein E3U55_10350 [Filobacillus milosensis]